MLPRIILGALPVFCCLTSALADQVFLSKDEALDLTLGKGCEISHREITLEDNLLDELKEQRIQPSDGRTMHLFTCSRDGAIDGYAFIDSQVGKHLPITYIVGVNPDGTVRRVEVMVYREDYGVAVKERQFVSQFEGKRTGEPLKVGGDIRNISGATISSQAMAIGVRRALFVWNKLLGARS